MTDPWAQQLEHDLNWREAELASMKAALLDAPKGSVRQRALLRAAWALLYAHYEGFSKFAWELYLETLEHKGLTRRDVSERLAKFSMAKKFQTLKTSMPLLEVWSFCYQGFLEEMEKPLLFEARLETKSNLWPDLFLENSDHIGISCDQMLASEVRIKSLVSRRNAIAHGEKMEIKDIEEYKTYEDCVFLILHELAVSMVENLSTDAYRSAPEGAIHGT